MSKGDRVKVCVSEVTPMAGALAQAVGTLPDGRPCLFLAEAATLKEAAEAIRNGGTYELLVPRASLRFAHRGLVGLWGVTSERGYPDSLGVSGGGEE